MAAQNAQTEHFTIAFETPMTLISGQVAAPVMADLRYTTRDPFAIYMVLSMQDSPAVAWVFARDLLRDGLHAPAGSGDIHLFPVPQGLVIDLMSPHGQARLLVHGRDLDDFVDDVFHAVPNGQESDYINLDYELAVLCDVALPRALEN